jgi:hypothetical protein
MATKTALKTAVKPTIKTRTKEADRDVHKDAKEWLKKERECQFEFSILAHKINKEQLFRDKGCETFVDYAKQEWGLEQRTAWNRVKVGKTIEEFGISKARAEKIGLTNFMEASGLIEENTTPAQFEKILKQVEGKTHDEVQRFKAEVKKKRSGGEVHTKVKMTFTFLDEQAEVVRTALNRAKELMGLEFDDLALEYALTEWLNSHTEKPAEIAKLKKGLKGEVDEVEDEAEEEEAKPKGKKKAAPKAKAKTAAKGKKKVEVDEDEDLDDDDDDEDEDADDVDADDDEDDDLVED